MSAKCLSCGSIVSTFAYEAAQQEGSNSQQCGQELSKARAELAELRERVSAMDDAMHALYNGYVRTLENGRDRILMLGGNCDSVDMMESGDPVLIAARAIIQVTRRSTSQPFKSERNDFHWYYAMDEEAEHYYRAESREDAIAKGTAMALQGDESAIWICEASRMKLHDDLMYFEAERVCEAFEEDNEMAWGEDGPERNVLAEAAAELAKALTDAFAAWRAKHSPWKPYMLGDFHNQETITVARPGGENSDD